MGDFGLQYDFDYHLEQIEDEETVDWDVLAQIFGTDVDFAISEVSIDANVSTSQKEAEQEMKEAFQNEEKENFAAPTITSKKRFRNVSDLELKQLEEKKQSKSTKLNTKWGVKLFQEWSVERFGEQTSFENIEAEELNQKLGKFYAEATPQHNKKRANQMSSEQASEYNKNAFKSIRSAINRHLQDLGRNLDIVRGREFKSSNNILDGKLKKNLQEGLALPTKHKQIIHTSDLQMISNYLYDNWNPVALRFRIWFLLSMQFVTRGLEFHGQLKTNSFVFTTDENGEEYVALSHDTKQKNWQGGIDTSDSPKEKRMYAIPDLGEKCPVNSLKLFLSKTDPNATSLFNHCSKPALSSPLNESIWFSNAPVKQYQFSRFMGDISKNAQCSKTYTAHCLRATAIQGMNDAGFEIRHIMHMSGHKNESSVRGYNRDCSTAQKKTDE